MCDSVSFPAPRCPWLRSSSSSPPTDVLSVLLLAAILVQGKPDVLTVLLDVRRTLVDPGRGQVFREEALSATPGLTAQKTDFPSMPCRAQLHDV